MQEEDKGLSYYVGMLISFIIVAFAILMFLGVFTGTKVRWAQQQALKSRM